MNSTKVRRIVPHLHQRANYPQTNGICERFHKTLQDECYRLLFRKKLYYSPEELQVDLSLMGETDR